MVNITNILISLLFKSNKEFQSVEPSVERVVHVPGQETVKVRQFQTLLVQVFFWNVLLSVFEEVIVLDVSLIFWQVSQWENLVYDLISVLIIVVMSHHILQFIQNIGMGLFCDIAVLSYSIVSLWHFQNSSTISSQCVEVVDPIHV